jgi:hypothetical protein
MTSWPDHLPSGNQKRERTEWQRIENQIDAAFVFARSDFVNVL